MMLRAALVNLGAVAAIGAVALAVRVVGPADAPPQQVVDVGHRQVPPAVPADKSPAAPAAVPVATAAPPRIIAPDVVPPPEVAVQALERVAPRPPLGDLGPTSPPRPAASDHWRGTLLYRPVVTSSASFEAMGYSISVAGTEAVDPGSWCQFGGVEWNCGERAMLAFRYWLRGRAPSCRLSHPAGPRTMAAACRLGRQDIGAWLVSNGWALAQRGGGYEKAEDVARKERMGIFGPPN